MSESNPSRPLTWQQRMPSPTQTERNEPLSRGSLGLYTLEQTY